MKDYKLLFAVLAVAIIWGTTFLFIRIGVESIPSWFVSGFRQFLAAIILFFVLISKKELKWIGWKNLKFQIIISSLMLIFANGLTTLAEKNITSSLASLISAVSPLLVLVGSFLIGLQNFSYRSLIGVLLGFSGIVFIFWDGLKDLINPDYRMGVFIMFFAIFSWSVGIIYSKKKHIKNDYIFLNLFYQFLFAGVIQIIFGLLFTEHYHINDWTAKSIFAIIYLAIFGSVITFFAFHYALTKITAAQVSILSYFNTIIGIFLGWLVLNEKISEKFIIATILIICGVFITNYKKGMFKRSQKI